MDQSNKPIIEKPDYELEALFGKDEKQVNAEWVLARYQAGEPLDSICDEFGVTPQTLLRWIRKVTGGYAQYKQTITDAKKTRAGLDNVDVSRITGLNRKQMVDILENNQEDITIKDRCQIEKIFGDRLAIAQGDITDRTEQKIGGLTVVLSNERETSKDGGNSGQ